MADNLQLRISNMLGLRELVDGVGFDDSQVEELESIILECNRRMGGPAVNQVSDSIYDTLYEMLKRVSPDSEVLSQIWEEDGAISNYTELLVKNPMMSIETAKSYTCDAMVNFIDRMSEGTHSYFASYKINGHGIRVVYEDGRLVSATSRARASAGRDLTNHMRVILGEYKEELAEYGIVELRGELCLKEELLSEARAFNPSIKSAFSAVSSLIKPSASIEELKLLDFLCYGFLMDGISFTDREEEFQEISRCGFETPAYLLIEEVEKEYLLDTIQSAVEDFENGYDSYGYFCDGVVFEINNRQLFRELGQEGNHNLGNIALKVGVWEQSLYSGFIQKILWTRGKSKLSPVAIVADEPGMVDINESSGKIMNEGELGVLTAQGNRVRRVPLYEPRNILALEAYVGELIHFRYGGEAGVVPCFPDGRLLTEDASLDILSGDYQYFEQEEGVVL